LIFDELQAKISWLAFYGPQCSLFMQILVVINVKRNTATDLLTEYVYAIRHVCVIFCSAFTEM